MAIESWQETDPERPAMLAGLMNGLAIDIDPRGERFSMLANRRLPNR